MNAITLYSLNLNPFRIWMETAWRTSEMMLASIQVIGHRSERMLSAGATPSAGDRRELALMGQEKVAAAAESVQAMALSWMTLSQQLGALAFKQMLTGSGAIASLAASATPGQSMARQTRIAHDTIANSAVAMSQLSTSVATVARRGLAPIHSRATSNAKRLRKHR